ncbi:MAG: chemotaxis protein, partial [Treponema sp.]|nr:chemotaxis protein [Treponema sp.]
MITLEDRIRREERDGEVIINYFRIALAVIYITGMTTISSVQHIKGHGALPLQAYCGPVLLLCESVILFFYLRKQKILPPWLKYLNVVLDMTIISLSIYMNGTFPDILMPISFLSIHALIYVMLIIMGAFRYNVRCAFFSGIYAGALYAVVIILNRHVIDVPYSALVGEREFPVSFPLYNETFRIIACIFGGIVTGIACKRHQALLNNMLKTEAEAAETTSKTVAQTREIAKTIQESTNDIFHSSKDIFTTA